MRPDPSRDAAAPPLEEPVADPRPLSMGDGPCGVLCVHGLTGTPHQVAPLAHALADAGFSVRAPLLAGHDDVESLEGSTWPDWYGTVEAELERLRDGGRRQVVLAGFSLGSLLSLRLAALRPGDVAGVLAMSTPLELPAWQRPVIRTLSRLRRSRLWGGLVRAFPKDSPDVRIEREERCSPSLDAFPFPALAQLLALQRDVDELLPLVRAPLLLAHGKYDHTAPMALMDRVAQRVSSPRVEQVVLPRSFHLVALDLDRERLCDEATRFCTSVLGNPEPSAQANATTQPERRPDSRD